MGFLLFAFRKLSLRRNISQKEFRLTTISNRILELQDQQSIMAQAKTSAQNAVNMFYASNKSLCDSVFQANNFALGSAVRKEQQNYSEILKNNNQDASNADVIAAKSKWDAAAADYNTKTQAMLADYQAAQSGLQMSVQGMNSIFSQSDNVQAQSLHCQETQLETEKNSLESSLKLLNQEYTNVCSAEDQEAKQVAPKFGLSG